MKVLKLTKENKELHVPNHPTSYMFAIEYGWIYELVEVAQDTILDDVSKILPQ